MCIAYFSICSSQQQVGVTKFGSPEAAQGYNKHGGFLKSESNLLQAEAEVGAEEEERAVEVHLVERDHQVVDAAVGEVVERLLLARHPPGKDRRGEEGKGSPPATGRSDPEP